MFELNNFSAIKLGLASPEKIRSWSRGEVTKPETINYRTQKPEKDGLFCERIFGPTKDWECHCGKYKRIRYKGVVCDKCGVEVTRKKVRRERMGHIELACPVSHIWFFRGIPSKIGVMLDLTIKTLEAVLYYSNYIVLDPKNTDLTYKQILTDKEFYEAEEKFGANSFRAGMGASAIKELLGNISLKQDTEQLREEVKNAKGQKKLKAANRLATVEAFFKSGNKPEWMIMDVLPVIPPDLRPIVQLDGGKIATSDLNDLYRRVINRNNRLKKLLEIGAPDIIVRNEKRMLQEAVDSLIDNGKRGVAVKGAKHELRSLTSILKGKQGRFRANMLGKRVDYSARSVITAGPELKMYQCGLSKHIALELFKPFILKRLVEMNESSNIKAAKKLIERERPVVWDVLEEVIKDHPVLLNRAPTLHRLGIQAFEPVLIEGNAIRLHPLVCTGFNADFDGDQMAVHVPLSIEAQTEARVLMLSTNNILKPSDGNPVCIPSQDMVMGAYYLTMYREGKDAREFDVKGEGMIFASEDEALYAWDQKMVRLQARIKVRKTAELSGKKISGLVETSVGRIIWNRAIPQSIGYVDRTKESEILKYEIDFVVGKKELGEIVLRAFNTQNNTICVEMLDEIKTLGFKYATLASNSISVFDMEIPEIREKVLAEAEIRVLENDKQYRRGLITQGERRNLNQQIWDEVFNTLKKEVSDKWSKFNPLKIMADSKARANAEQLAQLAGFVGQVSTASGKRLDVPVKSNYRLGLSNLEFFIKSRGGRKGFADTALKTSSSGYLTRRLVYAAQNIVVTEDDCFDRLGERIKGVVVKDIVKDGQVVDSLESRIYGRVVADDVKASNGEILVKANQMVSLKTAKAIVAAGIKEVKIRTVLTCRSKQGCCAKCYGKNMSSESIVPIGEAVGVIAAQAIGEPGTQLTMRTFHTGGIASASDITQGLPRVEELFEARRPKGMAIISEASGKVTLKKADKRDEVIVKTADDAVSYLIPFGKKLTVKNGDIIDAGTPLTEGSLYPQDILKTRGIAGVQEYLLSEILAAYASNSVAVNDKHIEILIRQMLRKVKIENSGDTNLIPGDMVDIFDYEAETEEAIQSGKQPATARRVVLGITKSVKNIESFLASAGFQETSNALINAAIRGRVDKLQGISENVIIGKKIPAGTGLKRYNRLSLVENTQVTTAKE